MNSVPTFRDFAILALELRKEQGIRGLSSERNRFALHIAMAPFARKPIDEIKPLDIRDWLRAMQQKRARDSRGDRLILNDTVKRSYSLVGAIFTAAIERDIIERSPCRDVVVKKRADENATRDKWSWLTLDEQKAIVACGTIPHSDRLLIRFAIATGLRQGEQCNLELTDIHVGHDDPHVFVRYGSRGHLPPKNGKTRRVPLFGDGIVAAKTWLLDLPSYAPENPHKLVFPSPRGTHRSIGKPLGAGGTLRAHLAHVGITRRVRWHDLRHTFCSNLVSGVLGHRWSLAEIRPLAGHSSTTIIERYSHIGEQELAKAAASTSFAHGPLVPLAPAAPDTSPDFDVPTPPETERELEAWFAQAVAS